MALSKLQVIQAEVAKNQAALLARSHAKYIKEYTKTLKGTIEQLQRELEALTGSFATELSDNQDSNQIEENTLIQHCLIVIHDVENTPDYLPNQQGIPRELAEMQGDESIKSRWMREIQGELLGQVKIDPPSAPNRADRYAILLQETYASAYKQKKDLIQSRIAMEWPSFKQPKRPAPNNSSKISSMLAEALKELNLHETRQYEKLIASASRKESRNVELEYLIKERIKTVDLAATLESQRISEEQQLELRRIETLKIQQSVIKKMISGWKQELASKAAEITETENQIKIAQEKEQLEVQKYNQKRVNLRSDQLIQKRLEREAKERSFLEMQQKREARLQRLRDTVSVIVERDIERATGPTFSSEMVGSGWSTIESNGMAIFSVPGYVGEFTDIRTQVSNALIASGMNGTDYSRAILAALPAPKGFRKDMQTSE